MEELFSTIRNIAQKWDPDLSVNDIQPLTQDASLRRYFRLTLSALPSFQKITFPKTIVAMKFDSVACPESIGGEVIDSDVAYVELSHVFQASGVSVPHLLFDAREVGLLFIEDLGDTQLFSLINARKEERATIDRAIRLLDEALQQIILIQSISNKAGTVGEGCLAFKRYFAAPLYIKEMEEFLEYFLGSRGLKERFTDSLPKTFSKLARELDECPRVLVHRDFHAWNLLVDAQDSLRVIDFQDALLGTRAYDLVSLINDRDMDGILGRELYLAVVRKFAKMVSSLTDESEFDFFKLYDRALLQRDLKVAGRFAKLVALRGLDHYGTWIPGTVKRIGRTLERLAQEDPDYLSIYSELQVAIPEISEGAKIPLRWFE